MKLDIKKSKLAALAKKYGLRFVLLHGSYATGKQREDSDIDIAALGIKPLSFSQQTKLAGDLDSAIDGKGHEVDFKMLNGVEPFFRYEVVRDGVLLYGDPIDYEEYKAVTRRFYDDTQDLRDLEYHLSKKYQRHLNMIARHYAAPRIHPKED